LGNSNSVLDNGGARLIIVVTGLLYRLVYGERNAELILSAPPGRSKQAGAAPDAKGT
jgi:hypothetical protein